MSSVPGPTLASGLPLLAGVPVTHAFLQARDLEAKHHLGACLLPYLPLSLLNLSPSGLHPQPGWSTIISPSQPSGTAPVSQGPCTQSHSSVPSWAGFVLSLAQDPVPSYCPQNTDPSHVCSSMLRCHCHLFLPAPVLRALASGSPSLFKIRFRAEVTHSQKH